ncbi:hypothetical protein JCM11491_005793 [Sporobolomyces phaffii]
MANDEPSSILSNLTADLAALRERHRKREPKRPPRPTGPRRLPDELLLEVLRDAALDRSDLAHCALLSRRYLDPVRELLYDKIDVDMVVFYDGNEVASEVDECQYARQGWAILRTLKENDHLAQMVRSISFELDQFLRSVTPEDRFSEKVDSTCSLTLSTFLRLAPNVTRVALSEGWHRNVNYVKVLARHPNVVELDVAEFGFDEIRLVQSELPHLKALRIADIFEGDVDPGTEQCDVQLANLETLELKRYLGSLIEFPRANAANLRDLSIDVDVALDLDFSQFPKLERLHLDEGYLPANGTPTDWNPLRIRVEKFWKSLAEAKALTTLSIAGPEWDPALERCFSRQLVHLEDRVAAIATLRTVRFPNGDLCVSGTPGGDVVLDRANSILASPLTSHVRRVVLPARYGRENRTPLDAGAANAIVAICAAKGIEVVYAD